MKRKVWNNIDVVVAPGTWVTDSTNKLVPDDCTIAILTSLCGKIRSEGKNSRMPICVDFVPVSVYSDTTRSSDIKPMYCALLPAQNMCDNPKICFRSRPHAAANKNNETLIDNVFIKHIFNHAAMTKLASRANNISSLQEAKAGLQAGVEILTEVSKIMQYFYVRELTIFSVDNNIPDFFSKVLNPVFVDFKNSLKAISSHDNIAQLDKVLEIVRAVVKKIAEVAKYVNSMQDSILSLALYVFEAESAAIEMLPYLIDLGDGDITELKTKYIVENTHVSIIHSVPIVNIETVSLQILKSLKSHSLRLIRERLKVDPKANDTLNTLLKDYLSAAREDDADLKAIYNKHMFMANYEIMHMERNTYTNPAQNLVSIFPEYVPLICKYPGIPNPILDADTGMSPWSTIVQQGMNGILSTALYQYTTTTNGQYETFNHMIDIEGSDVYSSLRAVLLPCYVFDSLTDHSTQEKIFIEPEPDTFRFGAATKDNMLTHSVYLSAIIMCSLLCSVADSSASQIFTSSDNHRLANSNVVAGYYTFDTNEDQSKRIPRNILADNVYGFCGEHLPLNSGEHTIPLSMYDLLLYKALIASKRVPIGIEAIKRGLDFTRWTNLRPSDELDR